MHAQAISLPVLATAALLALAPLGTVASAQPNRLGEHGDWTAASIVEGGQKVCYAFTRPKRSEGAPPGRQAAMLTVTHRASQRDAVILSAGFTFQKDAKVRVAVGPATLEFYTVSASAAPLEPAAAIRAFRGGRDAVAKAPGPGGRGTVTDTFSLAGFGAAYDAISRECPAGRGR